MDSLFPTPAASFDHPIDILDGCHERILRNCALIGRIAAHVASKGPDAEAATAAASVMRYFDTAGANHHRDEDEDVFPLLRRLAAERDRPEVSAVITASASFGCRSIVAMARRRTSYTRSDVVSPRGARWVTRRSRSSIHSSITAASSASFDGK